MTPSCRSFRKFHGWGTPAAHALARGGARGPRPSSVGRVTATPPATTPTSPDAPSTGSTGTRPQAAPPPTTRPPQTPIGRIPVQDVSPVVDGGARPAKSVVGEQFTVTATVFREGHDAVNASVVLTAPDGSESVLPMTCTNPGLNAWEAVVEADSVGWWSYRVEGWSDPYGTWEHDASIKVAADIDAEMMLEEGARVLDRALTEVDRDDA